MPVWTEESPRIPLTRLPLLVGRARECELRLGHPTVSRRHARLFRRDGQLVVADLDSRFGTYVNNQRVRERVLQPEDRLRFGTVLSYVVRPDALEREDARIVRLEVENLGIRRRGRQLLADVSVVLESGNLVGLLGPSGLGKSLLLRALAGYYPPDEGRVRYAGCDIWDDIEAYLGQVGLVPQTDVLYESLTLAENLDYAARLRLPNLSESARRQAVKDVSELLQLTDHLHKPVAVLSGGQRKRASVAIELLRKPPVLLLDEPTTGLDPGNEARLVENLAQVARRGTLVIMSTHSLTVLRRFDRVLVLTRSRGVGRTFYFGPPEGLEERLPGTDPADWYDLLERGELSPPPDGSHQTPPEEGDGGVEEAASWQVTPSVGVTTPPVPIRQLARRHQAGGFVRQWQEITERCTKVIIRDRGLLTMMGLQPVLLGLLIVLSQYHASKVHSVLFFSVVVAVWLGMNNTVRDLVRERRQYIRDRMAGLRADAYLAAKLTVFLGIGTLQLAVFVGLIRWGCGRTLPEHLVNNLHEAGLFSWLMTLGLVYLGGMGLGMVVSTLARTEEAAVAALPLLILPQILLSAVATGDVNRPYSDPRGFRPLVMTLTSWARPSETSRTADPEDDFWKVPRIGVATDVLSMLCYSRPALLVLTRPPVDNPVPGYSERIWLGDLLHLLILLLGTYTGMWWLFLRCESRWPALAGL